MNIPILTMILSSLVAQTVKRLPAMQETQVQSLRWEDPLRRRSRAAAGSEGPQGRKAVGPVDHGHGLENPAVTREKPRGSPAFAR